MWDRKPLPYPFCSLCPWPLLALDKFHYQRRANHFQPKHQQKQTRNWWSEVDKTKTKNISAIEGLKVQQTTQIMMDDCLPLEPPLRKRIHRVGPQTNDHHLRGPLHPFVGVGLEDHASFTMCDLSKEMQTAAQSVQSFNSTDFPPNYCLMYIFFAFWIPLLLYKPSLNLSSDPMIQSGQAAWAWPASLALMLPVLESEGNIGP